MPKKSEDAEYYYLRCSNANPQHVRVNNILNDLNLAKYKSRNQFMIDAVDFYAATLDKEDLTLSEVIENSSDEKKRKITVADMEVYRAEILEEAGKMINKSILEIMTGLLLNINRASSYVMTMPPANKNEETEYDETQMELLSKWNEE